VGWIQRFSGFLKEKPLHAAERHDAEAFIATLATSPQIEPWQIRQATDCVRLLLTAVLGKPWIDPCQEGAGPTIRKPLPHPDFAARLAARFPEGDIQDRPLAERISEERDRTEFPEPAKPNGQPTCYR